MFNKVVLLGNLTRDIELRYLQNGTAIGKTSIAVTRRYSSNGEKREETCFIDLDFFGRTAEIANQYLSKGSKILVEGRLKFDQWQDQNGQNRSKHSITVDTMEMLNAPAQGGDYQQNQNSSNYTQNSGYTKNYQQDSNYKNYSGDNKYPKTNYQNKQNNNLDENFTDNIPDVDVDADKYDNDETIPF